jgi:hypothetical protein
MKKQTKAVAAKRPRTYKKSDLPRTARAYLNAMGDKNMEKENEAVALLIELHAALRSDYESAMAELVKPAAVPAFVRDPEPKKLTLREQFLAWIGVKP